MTLCTVSSAVREQQKYITYFTELTVTITLSEYRELIEKSVENKHRKEHESWLEQYNRANTAENRVKELEAEVSNLYKRLAENSNADSEGTDE